MWTSEDLYTAKMLSEGFEPTPRETDFDSGNHLAKTSWMISWWNHPWMNDNVCSNKIKTCRWQVSNLRSPRETDFDSGNHLARTSCMISWWDHPWMNDNVCSNKIKTCRWQVSNLRSQRETDFDSVMATTLARTKLRWACEELPMSKCQGVFWGKTTVVGKFQTCTAQEKQIFILLL
jgi:hypothetical protein